MDLEAIFRTHQREIYVYFLRTLSDAHAAEDLAQETFTRACGAALAYRGQASFRTWLFSIARRVLADYFRRTSRREVMVPGPVEEATDLGGREGDPVEHIAIARALTGLPVAHREAIVLCDVLGFPPGEAAATVGVSASTFRVRLHRARRQFREVYGDV